MKRTFQVLCVLSSFLYATHSYATWVDARTQARVIAGPAAPGLADALVVGIAHAQQRDASKFMDPFQMPTFKGKPRPRKHYIRNYTTGRGRCASCPGVTWGTP